MKKTIQEYSNMEVLLAGIYAKCAQTNLSPHEAIQQLTLLGQSVIAGGLQLLDAVHVERQIDTFTLQAHRAITATRERTKVVIVDED